MMTVSGVIVIVAVAYAVIGMTAEGFQASMANTQKNQQLINAQIQNIRIADNEINQRVANIFREIAFMNNSFNMRKQAKERAMSLGAPSGSLPNFTAYYNELVQKYPCLRV